MRRVWMVFAAVMICLGVQAQEGFDAKMRRAGLVDVLAVDSTLRVKLMYSAPDNFMRRDVYGDLETAYLLPHFARKVAAAQRLLRERRPGWRLLVCDAARPVSVQRQMYELVKGTPNQVYVADGTRGGRHNYGVAVDVTLLDETGAPYYLYCQKYMSGSFENVGLTKPGGTGLYNIYIMEELHSILSLGAGGSTKMVGGGQIRRAFNAKYPREYIDRPEKRRANLMDFARFYAEQGE